MFVVEGGPIYLDKPAYGGVAACDDGFTLLELTRKYYREAGLDARQLDLLIRQLRHVYFSDLLRSSFALSRPLPFVTAPSERLKHEH